MAEDKSDFVKNFSKVQVLAKTPTLFSALIKSVSPAFSSEEVEKLKRESLERYLRITALQDFLRNKI